MCDIIPAIVMGFIVAGTFVSAFRSFYLFRKVLWDYRDVLLFCLIWGLSSYGIFETLLT